MAYTVIDNVQGLMPKFAISATSTPTTAQVEEFIDRITDEIDVILARQGVSTPVAAPATFKNWLDHVNALGACSLALAAMFPDTANLGPAGTALTPIIRRAYEQALAGLKDGSAIPDDAVRTSSTLATSYLQENPDAEVDLGDIANPVFDMEKDW